MKIWDGGIATKMTKLNGWQRIWLLLTVLAFVGAPYLYRDWIHGGVEWTMLNFALVQPDDESGLRADYDSGKCSSYITEPIGKLCYPSWRSIGSTECLQEPEAARLVFDRALALENKGSCWHIYYYRKRDAASGKDVVPYTYEVFAQKQEAREAKLRAAARQSSLIRLGQIWFAVLAGALLLYVGSYLIYRLMLWILEGFRR